MVVGDGLRPIAEARHAAISGSRWRSGYSPPAAGRWGRPAKASGWCSRFTCMQPISIERRPAACNAADLGRGGGQRRRGAALALDVQRPGPGLEPAGRRVAAAALDQGDGQQQAGRQAGARLGRQDGAAAGGPGPSSWRPRRRGEAEEEQEAGEGSAHAGGLRPRHPSRQPATTSHSSLRFIATITTVVAQPSTSCQRGATSVPSRVAVRGEEHQRDHREGQLQAEHHLATGSATAPCPTCRSTR